MKRFKNLLLVAGPGPVDRNTLARAGELTLDNGGRLTVVEVAEGLPEGLAKLPSAFKDRELQALMQQGHLEQLEELVAPLKKQGVKVRARVLNGTPFLAIIQQVYRAKHDLVIITAREAVGLGARLFGTTSLRLIRKCPCPVWVVKPHRPHKFFRILAAVDPTTPDNEENALNRRIMDLATSLTELEGSELHIGHAWTMWSEEGLKNRAGIAPHEVEEWARQAQTAHRALLDELLEAYPLERLKHQVHFVKGKPMEVIPELVEHERIDLIIMGSVCRTGIAGFFIGNTAEEILMRVNCSVLVVKPDAFVSPVRPES